MKFSIILQASTRSWSGGTDLCMNIMNGSPVLQTTIQKLYAHFSERISSFYIVAPEFDSGGLEFISNKFPEIKISYSHNDSPLLRMVEAVQELEDSELILRVNGINLCVDVVSAEASLKLAESESCDCVRFPDDFPSLFSSDVYRVGALRRMVLDISRIDPKYHIHPKYWISATTGFKSMLISPDLARYSDSKLLAVRQEYKQSMHAKRIEVTALQAIRSGGTITFHYELAQKYIRQSDIVLDLACGSGFGTMSLAKYARLVTGVDNDCKVIEHANSSCDNKRANFLCLDVLNMSFSSVFDVVVAFEIIEHIPPDALLTEIYRALKPNGLLLLSTPQNSLGHIPSTSDHIREFSLSEIRKIVNKYFEIEKIIGIKQGCIYFDDDPVGGNTVIVARKAVN